MRIMGVLFFPALGLQLSWSERPADNREVTSSNLVRPTTLCDNSHPNVSRVAVGVIIKTFWAQPEVSTGNQLSWESAGFASLRSGVRSPYSPPNVQGQGFCPWPFCITVKIYRQPPISATYRIVEIFSKKFEYDLHRSMFFSLELWVTTRREKSSYVKSYAS